MDGICRDGAGHKAVVLTQSGRFGRGGGDPGLQRDAVAFTIADLGHQPLARRGLGEQRGAAEGGGAAPPPRGLGERAK
jgi:hypothetical protein